MNSDFSSVLSLVVTKVLKSGSHQSISRPLPDNVPTMIEKMSLIHIINQGSVLSICSCFGLKIFCYNWKLSGAIVTCSWFLQFKEYLQFKELELYCGAVFLHSKRSIG